MFTSRVFFLFTLMLLVVNAAPVPRAPASRRCPARNRSSVLVPADPTADAVKTPVSTDSINVSSAASTTTSDAPRPNPTTSTGPAPPSSSAPAPPTTAAPAASGLLGRLFPVSGYTKSWTTSPGAPGALPLSDASLRPHNILTATRHSYAPAPDGKQAMRAYFPVGSYTFKADVPKGGFSFYAPGPGNVDLTTAKEATLGYSLYVPRGFDWALGGKLPGLYGGTTPESSTNCGGGSRSSACFSARLMWRENGLGEFYTYLPPYTDGRFTANNKVCDVPNSHCNPDYGASVGRGAFSFAEGAWTTISERVRLNDPGQANGQIELFANGKSVIRVDGLILRENAQGRIRGIMMQTFFGGSSPKFASPKNQELFFADFSVAITQTL